MLNLLQRLTDNYRKDSSINIGKLLNVVVGELEEVKDSLETTEKYRDIDQAIGATLDKIGVNVQQFRGVAPDEVYRILLKSKIARNLSKGDINTIIRVLAITLNTEQKNIYIQELYRTLDNEPAAIFVSVPAALLNSVGFSVNQFGRLVNRIVAAGVRANVLFTGTFAFSSLENESEFDIDVGFADTDQTSGGMLGEYYDPVDDTNLPLD
ncbi:conserved hypothetical protein [Alkaliphilus metalliredigens QYMF]|uniref:DUF2612 domain-containing protein n=1 Tax=Alkaliphilus metalliredigens (strain QYMF) TaxID=293826 RepID=A6TKE7_ALKMQ|nr:hypothetical protein [Alkaliphilus metalliredigens]ABR46665.1 conserved hypothetical protein [Alkaliphilus metalliredigens QYMF]ABR48137.1 conserved hypothetical protein [Alkaliphilus metalliredigens QYMF]ABR50418.1 conserved hypothetical protein [Alkaliphilus metalliredigens QYMF]